MTGWLRRLFGNGEARDEAATGDGKVPAAEPFIVNLFDDRVVVHRPDGQREELEWQALSQVVVRASSRAPWSGKAWAILIGDGAADGRPRGCVAPLDAINHEALVARLTALPGFDHAALEHAMRDARNGRARADAVCWQRSDADDPAQPGEGHSEGNNERDSS